MLMHMFLGHIFLMESHFALGLVSCVWQKGGGTIDLEPRLTHISALEPTLAPVSVERTMTTRSAASVCQSVFF